MIYIYINIMICIYKIPTKFMALVQCEKRAMRSSEMLSNLPNVIQQKSRRFFWF